jgi:hypothetical protein
MMRPTVGQSQSAKGVASRYTLGVITIIALDDAVIDATYT